MLTERERLAVSWAVVALLLVMVGVLWLGIFADYPPIVTGVPIPTTEPPPP